MLSKMQKISKDLIFYSVLLSEFEKPDFKNDALAGVRANFFNANGFPQVEKTDIMIDGRSYSLSYSMKQGEPILWKVTRDTQPFQTVKRFADGSYCVLSYGDNGIVLKRQYFDKNHLWCRTDYYDKHLENRILASVSPKKAGDIYILTCEKFTENGKEKTELFPSLQAPQKHCAGLVYSNSGMIWYDESFRPESFTHETAQNRAGGFCFTPEKFLSGANEDLLDCLTAPYLSADDIPTTEEQSEESVAEYSVINEPYSAYDKIENILFEAHKTNKNIFGELANHARLDTAETEDNSEEAAVSELADDTLSAYDEENDTASEVEPAEEAQSEFATEFVTEPESESEIDLEIEPVTEPLDGMENVQTEVIIGEEQQPDSVLTTRNGEFTYFGELDENGKRSGRGRTVTSDGLTAYDGEYFYDKRDGFGICYYKEGSPNYVGEWSMGNRSGRGVGYRLSDGTMHVGKWNQNVPEGFGARFDSEGNFLDVCTYINGVRNGKSLSFDEDGNLVVKVWKDGELLSEKIISD